MTAQIVRILNLFSFLTMILFTGCIRDHCMSSYTYWEPVYKTKDEVKANIKNNTVREIEKPGKIYLYGNTIFLNEIDKGIHVIDNSNPAQPRKISFIDIPGNMDIAVKGNLLYADFYTDLVTIDISNPAAIQVRKFTDHVFPRRYWGNGFIEDSSKVIADWKRKDTVMKTDCGGNDGFFGILKSNEVFMSGQAAGAGSSPVGIGGSMARFTIVNNYLYAVSNADLNVISLSSPQDPVLVNRKPIGWDIETIYPFKNRLFVGSATGMYIFSIDNPAQPQQLSQFTHARSCDPVIADDRYAFVTLRSGNECDGFSNQLDILDISDLGNPRLLKTYNMKNPHGLGKDGNTLIICDGDGGLKFYNAANVMQLIHQKTISGISAIDVITRNGWALVVAKEGLYQYLFTPAGEVTQLSRLPVKS